MTTNFWSPSPFLEFLGWESAVLFFFRCFRTVAPWHRLHCGEQHRWVTHGPWVSGTGTLEMWYITKNEEIYKNLWRQYYDTPIMLQWNVTQIDKGMKVLGRFPCLISYAFLPLSSIKMLPLKVRQGAPRSECVRPPVRCRTNGDTFSLWTHQHCSCKGILILRSGTPEKRSSNQNLCVELVDPSQKHELWYRVYLIHTVDGEILHQLIAIL